MRGQAIRQQLSNDTVYAVQFSPDSKFVASNSNNKSIGIYSTATGALLNRLAVKDSVSAVAFSPNGESVFVTEDCLVKQFYVANG